MAQYFIVQHRCQHLNISHKPIIHNADLRLGLGTFKSSLIESMYIIAVETPLKYRRYELLLKFAALNGMYN